MHLRIERTTGTLSYQLSRSFAEERGCRLPLKAEVEAYILEHGNQPLFQEDIWWPVADGDNHWVSVGNTDPANRLGHNHQEVAGLVPGWYYWIYTNIHNSDNIAS